MQTRSLYVRANAENIVPSYIVYYATIVTRREDAKTHALSFPLVVLCENVAE